MVSYLPETLGVKTRLLGVKLHNELLGNLGRDAGARRIFQEAPRQLFVVHGKPAHHIPPLALLDGSENEGVRLAARLHTHLVPELHLEAGNVEDPAVDRDVPVTHQPAGGGARRGVSHAEDDVVQSPFQHEKQVLARDALLALRFLEVVPELPLENAVDTPCLLLHTELETVARFFGAAVLPVLPGRVAAAFERALLGEAARPFEEELLSLPAAEPALGIVKRRHVCALNLPLSFCAALRAGSRGPQTRRLFGGRQPLWGMGVTSLMAEISSPAACSERMAASRPEPGPFTHTSTFFKPSEMASLAADSAEICAANGVLFREPLNPTFPALAQATVCPSMSVIVTMVLLNVDWTWAIPLMPTFRSRFFFGLGVAAGVGAAAAAASATQILLSQPAGFGAGRFVGATVFRTAPAVFFGPLRVRALVRVRWPRAGRFFRWRRPR